MKEVVWLKTKQNKTKHHIQQSSDEITTLT